MWNRQYNVTMQAPIGARYGTMAVTIDDSRVDGLLTILKKAAPFHGVIREDGRCLLTGELFTLMRTIPYEAVGWINQNALHLTLTSEKETFELSGNAVTSDRSAKEEEVS